MSCVPAAMAACVAPVPLFKSVYMRISVMRRLYVALILSVGLAFVVSACGSSGQLQYSSAEEAFNKGMERFENERYDRAADYFRAVFDFGRTNDYAADAQLYLARSHKAKREMIIAAQEYTRFLELYRTDERVPEAEYERAMTYYERSPRYQFDQTPTRQALRFLQLYVQRHPDAEHASAASDQIDELRNKLARKQLYTADHYERRGRYEAAALSYDKAFDQFPDTQWADDAILGSIRMYIAFSDASVRSRQAERLEPALERFQQMQQLFPDSPLLEEAERLHERAQRRHERLLAEN